MTRLTYALPHSRAGIDSLPMPGGGFRYYHPVAGLQNWRFDWRNSWDELRERLYGRYEDLLDNLEELMRS